MDGDEARLGGELVRHRRASPGPVLGEVDDPVHGAGSLGS